MKIYSNLAEIIQPLGKLPLEFSADDWSNIRSDSITLVGADVNVTEQSITEKRKSLTNADVYVRSPSSSTTHTKFIKGTIVDENRNLVKLIDKEISPDPIYISVPADQFLHGSEPPSSKYHLNFTYEATEPVYLSYLRSNLNWKTRYQLNLFDESKPPMVIAMADIRNDGPSAIAIEHAELLAGDINLLMLEQHRSERYELREVAVTYARTNAQFSSSAASTPSVGKGEEVAGLYVFPIDQPFTIEGKSNYLLAMFRPRVTIERYGSIRKSFFGGAGVSLGKGQRSYRLSSDRFLSRGNCLVREYDHLVGETQLPDLAANDKHEFSIGQDADIVYRENVTLASSRTYNETMRTSQKEIEERTQSVYHVDILLKNFKKNRPMKIEYKQEIYARSMKLITPNDMCTQDSAMITCTATLKANDEKLLSYKVELINWLSRHALLLPPTLFTLAI